MRKGNVGEAEGNVGEAVGDVGGAETGLDRLRGARKITITCVSLPSLPLRG